MSALTIALATFSFNSQSSPSPKSTSHSPSPPARSTSLPSDSNTPSAQTLAESTQSSSLSCSSTVPSLSTTPSTSSSCSSLDSAAPTTLRANEHLATLLPRNLWKPDSVASLCDNFYCRIPFNVFERRHHCRKCGGVFCASCTTRTTTLLDTSNLNFTYPPRSIPISSYDSPTSPVLPCRVCDDCWDQIHGAPGRSRTPDPLKPALIRTLSSPIAMLRRPLSATPSGDSSLSSSISTPPNDSILRGSAPRKARSLHNAPSYTSLNGRPSRRSTLRSSPLLLPSPEHERSYGELDAYPLKRSSVLCKATGGGRWEPKQSPVLVGHRVPVPGGKAPYEIEMEREEKEERARQEDIFVCDGDFKYRLVRRLDSVLSTTSIQP